MKKIIASCALLALAACASNTNKQPAPAAVPSYEIPAVYFDFNSTALTGDAKASLSNSLQEIENAKDLKLIITGYADMYGDDQVNMAVSKKRAESVKDYLTSFVPADSMAVEAKGKSELASTNPNAQDAERRVEVTVKNPKAAGTCPKKAKAEKEAAEKAAKKAKKASNQPWYSVLFDCMCED